MEACRGSLRVLEETGDGSGGRGSQGQVLEETVLGSALLSLGKPTRAGGIFQKVKVPRLPLSQSLPLGWAGFQGYQERSARSPPPSSLRASS